MPKTKDNKNEPSPNFGTQGNSRPLPEIELRNQSAKFVAAWQRTFGKTPPLGHHLRYDFFEHWTRFHALPKSKRYAENDRERDVIIHRANTLANACFGDQSLVWIATGHPSGFEIADDDLPASMKMSKAMQWIDEDAQPDDQSEITFFVSSAKWTSNALNTLFREIAEDHVRAIIFSEDNQCVLAPYDGGFDIVSLKPRRISELEYRYNSWMSVRPDKL